MEAMLRAFLRQIEYREERKNILRPTPAEYKDSKEFSNKLNEKLATLFKKSDEIQCEENISMSNVQRWPVWMTEKS